MKTTSHKHKREANKEITAEQIICTKYVKLWMLYNWRHLQWSVGAGIAQWVQRLGYGMDDSGLISGKDMDFFLFTTSPRPGSGVHPAYPMGTRVSFPKGKAAGAWT